MDPGDVTGVEILVGVSSWNDTTVVWERISEIIKLYPDGSIKYRCNENLFRQKDNIKVSTSNIMVETEFHLQYFHTICITIHNHIICLKYHTTREFERLLLPIIQVWVPGYEPSIISEEEDFIAGNFYEIIDDIPFSEIYSSDFNDLTNENLNTPVGYFGSDNISCIVSLIGGALNKRLSVPAGQCVTVQVIKCLLEDIKRQIIGRFALGYRDSEYFAVNGSLPNYVFNISVNVDFNLIFIYPNL